VTYLYSPSIHLLKTHTMPPRPPTLQPLKDFGNTLLFYLTILPLALANPNVLKDRDSRRDGKEEEKVGRRKEEEEGKAGRKDGGVRLRA
jgi:hypothetical protein